MRLYAYLAALAIVIAAFGATYLKGRSDMDQVWQARFAQAERDAQTKHDKLQEASNAITRQYEIDRGSISMQLADALERLRQRPERLPELARVACQGSTGAELSGADAGFLNREAARADELRASLKACTGWIDQVTEAFKK